MYNGSANWQAIADVKNAVKIPVIANGDIRGVADAKRALELSGADGVMIGRACYGKPWLIAQISGELNNKKHLATPSIKEQKHIVLEHFNEMIKHYGAQVGISLAKKHIGWYSAGLKDSAEFRAKINIVGAHQGLNRGANSTDLQIENFENQCDLPKNSQRYFDEAAHEIKERIANFYDYQIALEG
jgi:tRNA-dihydrouridine synthase